MIEARIVTDSINPNGNRLTTYVLTYPRFIHSEILTARMFSRNAASSRAIPIKRMLKAILKDPAKPVSWGQNGSGMQAKGELPRCKQVLAELVWVLACWFACGFSWLLYKIGVHKQLANRVTEPWAHMTTIVTATDFENFFALRCHPAAQPEFQELAYKMLEAYLASTPKKLKWGEWHLPFADRYIQEGLNPKQLVKIATARCARVSYLNFEGDIDHSKDYALHDQLVSSGHMSPTEHCAFAGFPTDAEICNVTGAGNFFGWIQYRKTLPNENRKLSREDMALLLNNRG